jgi:Cysteine-rich domain
LRLQIQREGEYYIALPETEDFLKADLRRDPTAGHPGVAERFGLNVGYPLDQTCCGQPMSNSGDEVNAAAAEHLFVENFKGYDCIVGPAGTCVKCRGGPPAHLRLLTRGDEVSNG